MSSQTRRTDTDTDTSLSTARLRLGSLHLLARQGAFLSPQLTISAPPSPTEGKGPECPPSITPSPGPQSTIPKNPRLHLRLVVPGSSHGRRGSDRRFFPSLAITVGLSRRTLPARVRDNSPSASRESSLRHCGPKTSGIRCHLPPRHSFLTREPRPLRRHFKKGVDHANCCAALLCSAPSRVLSTAKCSVAA